MQIKSSILRCSNCGGSDIKFDEESGKLKCMHCRSLIDGVMANGVDDVSALKGKIISEGAQKITKRMIDSKLMVTLKCSSCGSEVVVNTDEVTSARCPWCRHVLSIKDKLPNGAVPDLILPFKVSHDEAVKEVRDFISKRRSLAKSDFVNSFKDDAVVGVYLPYMVIDMNVHAKMSGEGEIETRRYTVGSGDDQETRYDADLYQVSREFDLMVDDLTIEASANRLDQDTLVNTNNVINAIMPFDTENAVEWDPRYVRGYTCEKRDVNVEILDKFVKMQTEDIMRYRMYGAISQYNRGVRWDKMMLERKGVKWKTAYLPVWLYSYMDTNSDGQKILHYVAINGRTKEVVGSAPVEWGKVIAKIVAFPALVLLLNVGLGVLAKAGMKHIVVTEVAIGIGIFGLFWLPIAAIILLSKVKKYRNRSARHMYEKETRASVENVVSTDLFEKSLKGLSRSTMASRNDNLVRGILRTDEHFMRKLGKILLAVFAVIVGMNLITVSLIFNALSYEDYWNKRTTTPTHNTVREIRRTMRRR